MPDEIKRRLPDAVVDELLAGAKSEEEIVGPGGVLARLTKRLVERALEVELTDHLGYEPHVEPLGGAGNIRNGSTAKTLLTENGPVEITTPRDRNGSFEPQLVRKRQRRFEGFDEKILALYSRGLSTREIERYLHELYGVKVSRDRISKVTDGVMDDVRAWQTRPLEDVYPVVFGDAFVLKVRENGSVARKACYLALGVRLDGERDVLGMWFGDTEGAKFWMHVLGDLRRRGVRDILICCVDGLKGFPEAIGRSSRGRPCRPVWCISSADPCATSPAASWRRSPRTSGRSTPRSTLITHGRRWRRSIRSGVSGSGRSCRPGRTPGSTSPRLGVHRRGPPGCLHHERDRSAQPPAAQSDQDQGPFPQRGCRPQAALSRDPERRAAMDAHPRRGRRRSSRSRSSSATGFRTRPDTQKSTTHNDQPKVQSTPPTHFS